MQGQSAKFDVLIRFRRHAAAVVCDISDMYLKVKLRYDYCKYLPFLWRQVDQIKEPSCYEFQGLVFGLNSAHFEAQYISQKNAKKKKTSKKSSHLLRKLFFRAHTWTVVWTVW